MQQLFCLPYNKLCFFLLHPSVILSIIQIILNRCTQGAEQHRNRHLSHSMYESGSLLCTQEELLRSSKVIWKRISRASKCGDSTCSFCREAMVWFFPTHPQMHTYAFSSYDADDSSNSFSRHLYEEAALRRWVSHLDTENVQWYFWKYIRNAQIIHSWTKSLKWDAKWRFIRYTYLDSNGNSQCNSKQLFSIIFSFHWLLNQLGWFYMLFCSMQHIIAVSF